MELPSEQTVLGTLDHATVAHGVETLAFVRGEDGRYFGEVRHRGRAPEQLPVRYTFGVAPLQQYLVDVGDGRLQAYSLAWDARPLGEGGQRWFHLHRDNREAAAPGQRLHFRGAAYNWNAMCADCHSTGVKRGYDTDADRFETTYAEIDVGCEACHGPGSRHVAWAESAAATRASGPADKGLVRPLSKPDGRRWVLADGADIAKLELQAPAGPATPLARQSNELDTCAPCHSRRADLGPAPDDDAYDDRYRLALIEESLYFADGQIDDEVFEYGSFLQSKMHAQGVVCSDCHEPHGVSLRAEGNALCARCHRSERFDAPAHHLHAPGSDAARCVACHMPVTTYMQVDARRDHRFGVPAPALSKRVGSPDVCTGCHRERDHAWAQTAIDAARRGPAASRAPGDALWNAWSGQPRAAEGLIALVRRADAAPIVRASALVALAEYPSEQVEQLITSVQGHPSALVRRAAAEAAAGLPADRRWQVIAPLLDDPARSVRMEVAGALMGAQVAGHADASQQAKLRRAYGEWVAARTYNIDRAEALVDLAEVARQGGDAVRAKELLERAIAKDPSFSAAHINLADLHRTAGEEARAIEVLRAGLSRAADRPMLQHALGLALVRAGDKAEGLRQLRDAYHASPERARLGYVYAVGLFDTGDADGALRVLRELHDRRPGDAEVLAALAQYARAAGKAADAERYAALLEALR